YVHAIVQDVARQLHAPAGLSGSALIEWLGRTARVRDAQIDCGAVVRRTDQLVGGGRRAGGPPAAPGPGVFRWERGGSGGGSGYSRIDRGDPQRGRQGGRRTG